MPILVIYRTVFSLWSSITFQICCKSATACFRGCARLAFAAQWCPLTSKQLLLPRDELHIRFSIQLQSQPGVISSQFAPLALRWKYPVLQSCVSTLDYGCKIGDSANENMAIKPYHRAFPCTRRSPIPAHVHGELPSAVVLWCLGNVHPRSRGTELSVACWHCLAR